jgi:hypothetical protein
MIELLLSLALVGLAGYAVWLHRALDKTRKGALGLVQILTNITNLIEEQSKINHSQQQLNDAVSTNLEILGVHTKLIQPDIAYEASAFLAWFNNKKKEGK